MNIHMHISKQAPVNKHWSTENVIITRMKTQNHDWNMEPTLQLELIEGWIMLYQKQNYDRFADSNNAVI